MLYLVPDLLHPDSGAGRHARTVCEALAQSGVSVHVLSLLDPVGSQIAIPGVTHRGFGGDRRRFAGHTLRSALDRPRLVLAQHASFSSLAWATSRLAGARLVVFALGIEVWKQLPLPRRLSLRRADLIIGISQYTADRASAANGFDAERLRVLPLCLDPAMKFDGGRVSGDGLSILTVGRMSRAEGYKGHEKVLRALPALLTAFPDLRYDIVGGGDGRPALEDMARAWGIEESVHFHGRVPESVLWEMYRRASVFIMPSLGEGFGLVFIEAMAFGTPVIAASGGAPSEIVRHGENGLLVDPNDPDDIETALRTLLGDEGYRDRLGQVARQDAQNRFGFPQYRDRLLALLGGLGVSAGSEGIGHRASSE